MASKVLLNGRAAFEVDITSDLLVQLLTSFGQRACPSSFATIGVRMFKALASELRAQGRSDDADLADKMVKLWSERQEQDRVTEAQHYGL